MPLIQPHMNGSNFRIHRRSVLHATWFHYAQTTSWFVLFSYTYWFKKATAFTAGTVLCFDIWQWLDFCISPWCFAVIRDSSDSHLGFCYVDAGDASMCTHAPIQTTLQVEILARRDVHPCTHTDYLTSRNFSKDLILTLLARLFDQLAKIVYHYQYIKLGHNVSYNAIVKNC